SPGHTTAAISVQVATRDTPGISASHDVTPRARRGRSEARRSDVAQHRDGGAMMTARQRRWLAAALGTGLTALMVGLATLDNVQGPQSRPEVVQRAVELYRPPPPPPPPARRSDARGGGGSAGRQLTLAQSRAPVVLQAMSLDVRFAPAEPGLLQLGGLGQGF